MVRGGLCGGAVHLIISIIWTESIRVSQHTVENITKNTVLIGKPCVS
jgi:hypothetical protein